MKTGKPESIVKYRKNYSESGFWDKVRKAARKAGSKVIYVALILYYELTDPAVTVKEKAVILGALGYFILPVDLIPDFIPVAGYTDDLSALLAAYAYIKSHLTPAVKQSAQAKLSEWFRDVDRISIDPDGQISGKRE